MGNDQDYLAKLQDYYADHGVLPSYATIMTLLGLRSKSPVAALVARFRLQGLLESAPDKRLRPGPRFFERTVYESVRAGFPSPASDDQRDALTIDAYLVERPSQTVLVRVKGDSMIDAGIHSGDTVIVEKNAAANVGDLVIAIVDNEFTLKTLDREEGKFILRPANPAYPIIRPKGEMEIFGVVVGQYRKYKRR